MKKIMVALVMLPMSFWTEAQAQTPVPIVTTSQIQSFGDWLKTQQAHAGIGYVVKGDKAKYAVTWWDLLQVGQSGMNVAQPSSSHDYVDIGPSLATANERHPRWGLAVPIHFGNIWNDIHLSSKIESHINKTPLPPIVCSFILNWPKDQNGVDLPINKLRPWDRDGMVAITYGFGGS